MALEGTMQKYQDNIAARISGNNLQPLTGAEVRVTSNATGLPAALYQDDELTPISQPLTTDNNGFYSFKAADGKYTLTYSPGPNSTAFTPIQRELLLEDPADNPFVTEQTLALQNGATKIGYGTGRTVSDKLGEVVSVKDSPFNAKGDGVTDDTAAIQAAITAAGAQGLIHIPAGTYRIAAGITVAENIVLRGEGPKASIIKPVGSFDAFTFTSASEGAGLRDIGFDGGGMTGGSLVVFNNSHRGSLSNIVATSPFNGIYATKVNVLSMRELWFNGIRGAFGVQCYGDASNRSDVIDMSNVILSCADNTVGATGILIDGNVNTVDIRHAACTKMGRGLWVKNTAGAGSPAFITAYDFQSDFPLNESIRLEGSARTILLTDVYTHGSVQADGIYIDESVQNVSIQGGQCDSHFKRGIFAGGRYIKVSNQQVCNNSAQGSAAWPGIEVGGASVGVVIVGNLAGQWLGYAANLQSYGVQIAAGAQAYVVSANNLRLNVTGELLDSANASDSVVAGNTTTLGKYAFNRGICSYSGDFPISAQGTGRMVLANANGTHLEVGGVTANVVNRLRISGDATGGVPKIIAEGSDSNLDIQLLTKGTGVARFGTHTANADAAITGYITIRDAGGTLRKLAVIA